MQKCILPSQTDSTDDKKSRNTIIFNSSLGKTYH